MPFRRQSPSSFDYVYGKDVSVLTKLRFRLKPEAPEKNCVQFDITLFPNSLFIIPLSSNRLYTHEIVPSGLPADKIPTRMGYVIRCSETPAVHRNGQTYIIKNDGVQIPLRQPTSEGVKELTDMYFLENTTIQKVEYRDRFYFSMNSGDYLKPIL